MFNDIHIREQYSGRVANVQEVGLELGRIWKANKEVLTPEIVLKNAASEASPIHNCFTWDDSEAAKKCRLIEAQMLIRSIKVIVEPHPQAKPIQVRAFVSIDKNEAERDDEGKSVKPDRSYIPLAKVISNDDYRKQMLRQALAELAAFRRKYSILTELSDVFNAVEKAQKKLPI